MSWLGRKASTRPAGRQPNANTPGPQPAIARQQLRVLRFLSRQASRAVLCAHHEENEGKSVEAESSRPVDANKVRPGACTVTRALKLRRSMRQRRTTNTAPLPQQQQHSVFDFLCTKEKPTTIQEHAS
eukprot:6214050-Pleurochrysis_carterae.AAC.1